MTDHRRPPMPRHRGHGFCTWCGDEILYPPDHKRAGEQNMRRTWHPDCVVAYKIATGSADQRRALRQSGKIDCAECGIACIKTTTEWEADHKIPLWSVPGDIPLVDRPRYWGMENLQILCRNCHKAKCAREAAQRAALKSRQARLPICEAV